MTLIHVWFPLFFTMGACSTLSQSEFPPPRFPLKPLHEGFLGEFLLSVVDAVGIGHCRQIALIPPWSRAASALVACVTMTPCIFEYTKKIWAQILKFNLFMCHMWILNNK
jgi:hypothetical protein